MAGPQIDLIATESTGESALCWSMDLRCFKRRIAPRTSEKDADNPRGLVSMHWATSARQGSIRLPCGWFCKREFCTCTAPVASAFNLHRNRARCSNLRLVSRHSFRFHFSLQAIASDLSLWSQQLPLLHTLLAPTVSSLPRPRRWGLRRSSNALKGRSESLGWNRYRIGSLNASSVAAMRLAVAIGTRISRPLRAWQEWGTPAFPAQGSQLAWKAEKNQRGVMEVFTFVSRFPLVSLWQNIKSFRALWRV
jgi:hypothetical protein